MADAFGVALFPGLADVMAEVGRHDLPESQLTGMERDVHLRILLMQPVEHVHVLIEIMHWDVSVLWLDEVKCDDTRIRLRAAVRHEESSEGLREHALTRHGA